MDEGRSKKKKSDGGREEGSKGGKKERGKGKKGSCVPVLLACST